MDDPGCLVARVRDRDIAAFESLYDSFQWLVYAIAVKMLGNTGPADDVVQKVFLKLWAAPEAFRGGNVGGWLSRITRNCAIDELRAQSRRWRGDFAAALDIEAEYALEDAVLASVEAAHVRRALETLRSEQRIAIELGFFSGMTHQEIANVTHAPLGTVKTRVRTGLRKLRLALEVN